MTRTLRRISRFLLLMLLAAFLIYCWLYFPIMTGFVAKSTCSAVFVSSRNPADIEKQDFNFPFSLVSTRVDLRDSSVTSSILGLARRKAIYRRGFGATLVVGITEAELRQQSIVLAASPPLTDTMPWPQGDRLTDSLTTGVDTAALHTAVNAAFYDTILRQQWGTRALIVVYKGQIVAERYAPGFTAKMPLLGWSMTKSVLNALLGILVQQKKLDIHEAAPVAAWQQDDRRKITYENLMQMTSGQRYWWFPLAPSDVTNMLFKEKDMAGFAEHLPLQHPPGSVFHYSDGNAVILSRLIRDRLGGQAYYRFPYEQLFDKIGMHHTILEADASGTFVGCSYCYATARDWARFGLFYLRDGIWNGQRLLPEGWVRWTASPSGIHNYENFGGEYGALWWVNAAGRKDYPGWKRMYNVPVDCFSCEGLDGQEVHVIPSKDLVIVRLSQERNGAMEPNLMLYGLLKAFP
jgi:CubicO group peptidase (beta-lactamase class C family)